MTDSFIMLCMRAFQYPILLCFVFFLLACAPGRDEVSGTSTFEPASTTETSPSSTASASPTGTFTPFATSTAVSASDTPTPQPVLQLCSPLAEQSIQEIPEIVSDPYNPPRPGKDDRHQGTDLAYYRRKDRLTIEGEGVQALLAGRVAAVVVDQLPYGNMVIIETPRAALPAGITAQFGIAEGESLYTLYAHFKNPPFVNLGDGVACGQALGEVGATGYNIVNPHVHLETRVGPAEWIFVDGMAYYDTRTTAAERASYELWRTSGLFRHFDPMALLNEYLANWAEE